MLKHKYALLLGTVITTVMLGTISFAADKNLSYANVVGMENYISLSDTVKGQIEENLKNLPDSLLDLHRRYGAAIIFVDGPIPIYIDETASYYGNFDNDIIGVTYLEGDQINNIYVRTDDKAVYNHYGEYWRTISHELGHFMKNVTYDMWTPEMKEILEKEYLRAKDISVHCYSEEETFAREYSLYCESDSLVSDKMCSLFRNVEEMAKIQDMTMGGDNFMDPVRTDNIVEKIDYNPIDL